MGRADTDQRNGVRKLADISAKNQRPRSWGEKGGMDGKGEGRGAGGGGGGLGVGVSCLCSNSVPGYP